jgi:hypothetical protein
MWFKSAIVTVIKVVVAAGCANKEDVYVSLGDTTVLRTVFDVERRTQVSVQHIKVFAGTETDVSKDAVSGACVGMGLRRGTHCTSPGRSSGWT